MDVPSNGELVPVGGGDPIPLVRSPLVLGRRSSCDIYLPFPNISGRHCELIFKNGFWIVRDLNSTNGMKVNGDKVQPGHKKALSPGDTLTLGKRQYKIEYILADRMSRLEEMMLEEEEDEDIMGVPLLEKAGLEKPGSSRRPGTKPDWDMDEEEDDDD